VHGGHLDSQIFWLNGLAGTGKSTIARTVCETLDLPQIGALAASFFFSRREAERRDPIRAIHTMAYQLALRDAGMREHIRAALQANPTLPTVGVESQIRALVAEPLQHRQDPDRRFVLVLDALDECDKKEGREGGRLLTSLAAALRGISSVKLFVTSRDESSIQQMFRLIEAAGHSSATKTIRLHNMEKNVVIEDIRAYLVHSFKRIADDNLEESLREDWPGDAVVEELLKRTGVLFIFAATLVRYISDEDRTEGPAMRLEQVIKSTEAESCYQYDMLDRLYQDTLDRAATAGTTTNAMRLREELRSVLGVLVLIQEPLSSTALAGLLSPALRFSMDKMLQRLSAVLILEDGHPVTLFHPSFSDFILDPSRCRPLSETISFSFHIDPPRYQLALARRCLRLLNTSNLRYDICGLSNPGLADTDVPGLKGQLLQHTSEALRYACRHWIVHLPVESFECSPDRDVQVEWTGLLAELNTFCARHTLHWLEIMSLIGELSAARSGLYYATAWCKVT
jgi:hypothetical protein